MGTDSQQIVDKAWNFAHVPRDDGLSYMAYTKQITFLLKEAFEGKLVPQDPSDETASTLLERICEERSKGNARPTYNGRQPRTQKPRRSMRT
jgi:hypothetical protein